ncbi:Uu.00g097750.m01.CDS01 [Anthostomella pinea]|uniref:Uu.00g097750.m01.CDS01 n=1 Tax=Anthostomella pinea TaxID=933095 RepID=A0AAI8YEZ4_9PEZI|nr:Uu.00g097750.m01.CDS01 [Anthostomella pinea]
MAHSVGTDVDVCSRATRASYRASTGRAGPVVREIQKRSTCGIEIATACGSSGQPSSMRSEDTVNPVFLLVARVVSDTKSSRHREWGVSTIDPDIWQELHPNNTAQQIWLLFEGWHPDPSSLVRTIQCHIVSTVSPVATPLRSRQRY